jgi:hypothetical protein
MYYQPSWAAIGSNHCVVQHGLVKIHSKVAGLVNIAFESVLSAACKILKKEQTAEAFDG